MFAWIYQHLAVILICAALLLLVFLAVRSMVRDRRAGKSICGGSCASCPMGGQCGGGRKDGAASEKNRKP